MATATSDLSNIDIPAFPAVQAGRHPWFYFKDGTIVLKVDDPRVYPVNSVLDFATWQIQMTLFKVHRHFLTEYSPVFKDMWTIGSSTTNDGEGFSDDNPISLNGDDPEHFSCLFQLFYHK